MFSDLSGDTLCGLVCRQCHGTMETHLKKSGTYLHVLFESLFCLTKLLNMANSAKF
jgi:hypothetical protein